MTMTLLAATAADSTTGTGTSMLLTFIPLALMLVIFYFLLIRPEKKRAKKMKEMLDNLQVADEVVTTGGIIGRVLSVKDDTVLIETGGDRTRIRILRSSIAENRTTHDDVESVTIKK
ncbi:MAG: preprotein translocase subunit YajC [Bacteroides sp.]|nr:preprotein translocase subunit YajC [Eubacterium sp.]MCM1418784.1 preprotein translocase subunit YajC [Roseburia sp.]MCM1462441.1 preprotein translocase subunit YajC [Bacteroides sp.]